MQVIFQSTSETLGATVATVGIFDGVHAGHRFLIDELKSIAQTKHLRSTVITFAQHPRKVLDPNFNPLLLTSLEERIAQIDTTGIDCCIVIDFDLEMAALSAYDFIQQILFNKFNVQVLLVGHDHRFGHNRAEGFPEYQQYGKQVGVEVIQASRFSTNNDEMISSTEIRTALQVGDVERANRLLTYRYSITGVVVKGFQMGRKMGFPTANVALIEADKHIPANGVYAVQVKWGGTHYNGMLNIGVRPTVSSSETKSIEVNIFDFDADIYDQQVEVIFIAKIRDEKKFESLDDLVAQLMVDRQMVLDRC